MALVVVVQLLMVLHWTASRFLSSLFSLLFLFFLYLFPRCWRTTGSKQACCGVVSSTKREKTRK